MLVFFSIISYVLLYSSLCVSGGQELSSFQDKTCDPAVAAWTSWFNIQDPLVNNGHDIEDLTYIKVIHREANRCGTVFNVDYSVVEKSNDENGPYQTLINHNGLFCMGSRAARCPNYRVRFCCSLTTSNPSPTQQCGQTFNQPNLQSVLRVVNGYEARPHSLPWAVSFQYKGVHDCGGVILDQWNILTAAHCLDYSNDLGNYVARVGAHHKYRSGQIIPIAKLILHPKYNETRSSDDIGIVKLAQPITFTNEIQPICLIDSIVEPPLDSTVYVAGWGNTVHDMWNSSSDILLQARLRVVSDCSMYFAYEPQNQICAIPNGPIGKDHGSCQGDSGGGLLYLKNGRWHVAGVVSYAIGCGRQAFPTVFTKTSAYIGWIRAMMNLPIST